MHDPRATRRDVLRAGAGTVATVAGLGTLAGPAAADHTTRQPAHVTLTYDEARLNRYRPRLVVSDLAVLPNGLYGWVAQSPEYDTDVMVYWAEYPNQEGVTDYDSHVGDHEPVYVVVDEAGDVQEVVYSEWHWLAARDRTPALDGDHPLLHVVERHHQYEPTTRQGSLFDIRDLTAYFQPWLDNGLEGSLEPGTVVDPWRMVGTGARPHWWRDSFQFGPFNVSLKAEQVRLARRLGWNGLGGWW